MLDLLFPGPRLSWRRLPFLSLGGVESDFDDPPLAIDLFDGEDDVLALQTLESPEAELPASDQHSTFGVDLELLLLWWRRPFFRLQLPSLIHQRFRLLPGQVHALSMVRAPGNDQAKQHQQNRVSHVSPPQLGDRKMNVPCGRTKTRTWNPLHVKKVLCH